MADDPFVVDDKLKNYSPEMKAVAEQLDAKLKTLDPAAADALVAKVNEEIKKKKSGAEILSTVFSVITKGVGLVL